MNKNNTKSLRYKIKNFALKHNIEIPTIMQNYMFEHFLKRLSLSKYKDNFVLKGGVLLTKKGIESFA